MRKKLRAIDGCGGYSHIDGYGADPVLLTGSVYSGTDPGCAGGGSFRVKQHSSVPGKLALERCDIDRRLRCGIRSQGGIAGDCNRRF